MQRRLLPQLHRCHHGMRRLGGQTIAIVASLPSPPSLTPTPSSCATIACQKLAVRGYRLPCQTTVKIPRDTAMRAMSAQGGLQGMSRSSLPSSFLQVNSVIAGATEEELLNGLLNGMLSTISTSGHSAYYSPAGFSLSVPEMQTTIADTSEVVAGAAVPDAGA